MTRRKLVGLLAAIPFIGFIAPKVDLCLTSAAGAIRRKMPAYLKGHPGSGCTRVATWAEVRAAQAQRSQAVNCEHVIAKHKEIELSAQGPHLEV